MHFNGTRASVLFAVSTFVAGFVIGGGVMYVAGPERVRTQLVYQELPIIQAPETREYRPILVRPDSH